MSTAVETAANICPECGYLIDSAQAHKCKFCEKIICHLCTFFHLIDHAWEQEYRRPPWARMGIKVEHEWPRDQKET